MLSTQVDDAATQAQYNAENLAHIALPEVREAYRLFLREADVRGIPTSVLPSSGARPLRFYRNLEGELAYFFSCDRTREYLRCYIRQPSLRVWPELRALVIGNEEFDARELNDELRIIVSSIDDAQRLVGLLFDRPEKDASGIPSGGVAGDLKLVEDSSRTTSAFTEWYACLTADAKDVGGYDLLPGAGIGFRKLKPSVGDELRVEFWIGSSSASAVQINEPNAPGTENPLAGLAVDENGRRYIVRQGVLHKNNVSARVEAPEFASHSGLDPVTMRVGDGRAKRQWHIVTPLDEVSDDAIVQNTLDFVGRCWRVRTWDKEIEADQARLTELFGEDERGGWFEYIPDPTPRRVLRLQGEVWQALSRQLALGRIAVSKPKHARGYEVDAEVVTRTRSLLVEIKSGFAAADYYCAVGQLMLYPAVLSRLAEHEKILLLPEGKGSPTLEATLGTLGIQIYRYRLTQDSEIEVRFSADFLRLCGLSQKIISGLNAF